MDYIAHHGILGQKWGIRRYQNADGSLTTAGKRHYGFRDIDAQRNAQLKYADALDRKAQRRVDKYNKKGGANRRIRAQRALNEAETYRKLSDAAYKENTRRAQVNVDHDKAMYEYKVKRREALHVRNKLGEPTNLEKKAGLTPTQKKLLIGAGVTAVGIAGAVAVNKVMKDKKNWDTVRQFTDNYQALQRHKTYEQNSLSRNIDTLGKLQGAKSFHDQVSKRIAEDNIHFNYSKMRELDAEMSVAVTDALAKLSKN